MVRKNFFYNSILSVSQFIFPLITFPYSTRILGPLGIGSVNFIDSFTQYFLLFSALGIPIYGIREVAKRKDYPEELSKLVNEIFSIHLFSTLAFTLVYLVTALSVHQLRSHLDLVFVGIITMLFAVFGCEWFFQGIEQFKYITARSLIFKIISVVFLFVFLHKGSPSIIYYLIGATSVVLGGISNQLMLRKIVSLKLTTKDLKKHLKPLIIILGSSVAVSIYLLLDNIILGFLKGEAAVGIYSTALRIVRIPIAIVSAMSISIVPQVSRAFSNKNSDEINVLMQKSFSFISLLIIPIAFGMFISSPFLIETFAGNKFHDSELILKVLSPVILLIALNNIFGIQLLAPLGKEKLLLRAVSAGMIFSVAMNSIVIRYFSYTGAAITNMCTEIVVTVLCFYYVKKYVNVSFDFKVFFQCFFAACIFFPIEFLLKQFGLSEMLTQVLIIITCAVFYLSFVWIFVKNSQVENIKQQLLSKFRPRLSTLL